MTGLVPVARTPLPGVISIGVAAREMPCVLSVVAVNVVARLAQRPQHPSRTYEVASA